MIKGVNKCLPSFLFTDDINVLVITEEVADLLVESKVINQYFMQNVVVTDFILYNHYM